MRPSPAACLTRICWRTCRRAWTPAARTASFTPSSSTARSSAVRSPGRPANGRRAMGDSPIAICCRCHEADNPLAALRGRVANAATRIQSLFQKSPLAPVLRGEGPGVRGFRGGRQTPSPQPLSPEYGGEGLSEQTLSARRGDARPRTGWAWASIRPAIGLAVGVGPNAGGDAERLVTAVAGGGHASEAGPAAVVVAVPGPPGEVGGGRA